MVRHQCASDSDSTRLMSINDTEEEERNIHSNGNDQSLINRTSSMK